MKAAPFSLGSCLNRGLSRILRMTRILGFGFIVGFGQEGEVREITVIGTQTGKFALQRGGSLLQKRGLWLVSEVLYFFVIITIIYKIIESFTIARLDEV